MESLSLPLVVLVVALFIWILTSSKNRKAVGKSVTVTLTENLGAMAESAQISRLTSKVEGMAELVEEFGESEIETNVKLFDKLINGKLDAD